MLTEIALQVWLWRAITFCLWWQDNMSFQHRGPRQGHRDGAGRKVVLIRRQCRLGERLWVELIEHRARYFSGVVFAFCAHTCKIYWRGSAVGVMTPNLRLRADQSVIMTCMFSVNTQVIHCDVNKPWQAFFLTRCTVKDPRSKQDSNRGWSPSHRSTICSLTSRL